MAVTEKEMTALCKTLLAGHAANPDLSLSDYIRAAPGMASLDDLASGTPVLVRADVDAKPGAERRRGRHPPALDGGHAAVRPRARLEADHLRPHRPQAGRLARQGRQAAGRDHEVRRAAHRRLARRIDDDDPPGRAEAIADAKPGSVLMLENTRKYEIERVLWKAKADDLAALGPQAREARQRVRRKARRVYVNEALSAGSLDACSVPFPRRWIRSRSANTCRPSSRNR